ncbi:MAG: SDR family oxidoreductase [Bacteroidales bacterium]
MFKGKVVIVTGASSGIGKASATEFALLGAKVVLVARNRERLERTAQELSPLTQVLSIECDVKSEEECKKMVDTVLTTFGRIDILINNAGISMRALFNSVELSVLREVMEINFWGTVNCTKWALPHILESGGSIVGVISIAGYKGLPARTGYSASKFAIYGFLETLRIEHLKDRLHVMIFAPGFTSSNIRENALLANGAKQGETPRDESKMMSAQECAKHLVKGIRKRKREVILTPIGKLLVFLNKLSPKLVDHLEYNFMKREKDSPLK